MSTPHKIKDWWQSKHRAFNAFCQAVNLVARWVNEYDATPPLQSLDTGRSALIRINPAYGYPVLNIKVTGAKDGDYYPADVYASGTEAAATSSSVDAYFPDFDIDPTATQGFYPAVRIETSGATVYQVIGLGTPPALGAGYFYPRLNSGVFEYVPVTNC